MQPKPEDFEFSDELYGVIVGGIPADNLDEVAVDAAWAMSRGERQMVQETIEFLKGDSGSDHTFASWLADRAGLSFDDCGEAEQEKWLWEAEAVTREVLRRAALTPSVEGGERG